MNYYNEPFQTMAELYLRGVELLEQLGLPRYEVRGHATVVGADIFEVVAYSSGLLSCEKVSNFGQTECLHNTGYWSGRPYLGLGPGAHSRIGLGHLRTARV